MTKISSVSWKPLIPLLSDHLVVHCHLNFTKQVTKSKLRAFRKMRSFDVDKFCLELSNSELLTSTPVDDLHVLVDCYNATLNTLIDLHAPIVYKPVTLRSRMLLIFASLVILISVTFIEHTKILVNAFVTSRLDNCNSLLYGLPCGLLHQLQNSSTELRSSLNFRWWQG